MPQARQKSSKNINSLPPINTYGYDYCDDDDKDGGENAASLRTTAEENKLAPTKTNTEIAAHQESVIGDSHHRQAPHRSPPSADSPNVARALSDKLLISEKDMKELKVKNSSNANEKQKQMSLTENSQSEPEITMPEVKLANFKSLTEANNAAY